MGKRHSSTVSNANFLVLAEKPVLHRVREFSILFYFRYEDDVLIVADGSDRIGPRRFLGEMRRRAPDYRIKVDDVKSISIHYLEVRLSKTLSGRVEVRPQAKAVQGVPLSERSCHAPPVHRWPATMMTRTVALSSTAAIAREAQDKLLSRFAVAGASDARLELMRAATTRAPSRIPRPLTTPRWPQQPLAPTWLVASFHPALYAARLSKFAARFFALPHVVDAFRSAGIPALRVRLSWKAGCQLPSLKRRAQIRLQKLSEEFTRMS